VGNKQKAMADWDSMLERYRKDSKAKPWIPHLVLAQRALIFRDRGDLDQALAGLNEAIRLDPGYAAAYRSRADVLERMGDAARARADRDMAKRLDTTKRR
jgi:tetratricopeptide (TPR) repeat protein